MVASVGAYHPGAYPLPTVLGLAGLELVYAMVFPAVGANRLVPWPVTWAVGARIGTIQGGFLFGWEPIPRAGVVLAIRVAAIAAFAWYSTDRDRSAAGHQVGR